MGGSPRLLDWNPLNKNSCFPYKIANDLLYFLLFFWGSTYKKNLNFKKTEWISQFYFKLWIFEFLCSFWNSKFFWKNYKHEQIIVGGCGFLQKNTFSQPFQEKIETREFCRSLRRISVFLFWRGVLIHLRSTVCT